jgi:hypothetical protein
VWALLFTLAFSSRSPRDVDDVRTLLRVLPALLPCRHCRRHCERYGGQLDVGACKTGDDLGAYLWSLKDMVNQRLRRPSCDFVVVRERYDASRAALEACALLEVLTLLACGLGSDTAAIGAFQHAALVIGDTLRRRTAAFADAMPAFYHVRSARDALTACREKALDGGAKQAVTTYIDRYARIHA